MKLLIVIGISNWLPTILPRTIRPMSEISLRDALVVQFDRLPHELQLRVLDFARNLIRKGVKGKHLLRFEGAIPADDLAVMSELIERECGGLNERYPW